MKLKMNFNFNSVFLILLYCNPVASGANHLVSQAISASHPACPPYPVVYLPRPVAAHSIVSFWTCVRSVPRASVRRESHGNSGWEPDRAVRDYRSRWFIRPFLGFGKVFAKGFQGRIC